MWSSKKSGSFTSQNSPSISANNSVNSYGTVTFVVGGERFEISTSLIAKYPTSKLNEYMRQAQSTPSREVFLDHNPQAFSCIMDFLRYEGRILVPRSVCMEVVQLQLRMFGLDHLDEKLSADDSKKGGEKGRHSGLPTYDDVLNRGAHKSSSSLSQTVAFAMEAKMRTLIENFVMPLVIEHAQAGHPSIDVYLLDEKIKRAEVASTLNDNVPIEWIFLTNKILMFGDSYGSSSSAPSHGTGLEGDLSEIIKEFDGLSVAQREKLLRTIDKSRETHERQVNKTDLPDVSYLIQSPVLQEMQKEIVQKTSIRSCMAERVDLTIRRENEYGLLESTCVTGLKLSLHIV